ncbi:hypothetical protein BX616_004474, partial [Lobosporangium transversale]
LPARRYKQPSGILFQGLKAHALEGKRDLRIDFLIYELQGSIDQNFRTLYFKTGECNGRKSRERKGHGMRKVDRKRVRGKVVRGFQSRVLRFRGCRVAPSSVMFMPDYVRHKIPYKHMYLVSRTYDGFNVQNKNLRTAHMHTFLHTPGCPFSSLFRITFGERNQIGL